MNFEQRIYQEEFKLNDTDSQIIEYILNNKDNIHNISIHNIAKDLFMAPNAIMRLSKKLGYSGFSELKFSINQELDSKDHRTIENKVLSKLPQNIINSLDVLDDKIMKLLVTKMKQANKIVFVGIGDSVYFCELFGRYLRCYDKKVEYYQQIHDIEYAIRFVNKDDLVIVISASGEVERLIDLATNAKKLDAYTFCITHYGKNTLADICDAQLTFWGERRIVNGYNVTDRSGLMMLIRLICEEYWRHD